MAVFRAFKALRPAREKAAAVAALPYDVVSREEAAAIGKVNPDSFLHVDRAEMDLPADTGLYDPEVYKKAKENLLQMEKKGILSQDHMNWFAKGRYRLELQAVPPLMII